MKKGFISVWLIASVSLLTACEHAPNKRQTGAVIGGILGGVLGHQIGRGRGRTAATIIGTLAGGALGSYVGSEMDTADELRQQQALEYNPTNTPSTWVNPDTQTQYTVTPTQNYANNSGQDCRDYTTTIYVDGHAENARGTACRDLQGHWSVN